MCSLYHSNSKLWQSSGLKGDKFGRITVHLYKTPDFVRMSKPSKWRVGTRKGVNGRKTKIGPCRDGCEQRPIYWNVPRNENRPKRPDLPAYAGCNSSYGRFFFSDRLNSGIVIPIAKNDNEISYCFKRFLACKPETAPSVLLIRWKQTLSQQLTYLSLYRHFSIWSSWVQEHSGTVR